MTRYDDSKLSVRFTALALIATLVGSTGQVQAHHPDKANAPVWQYIDVIPPLGNHLPPGYRRKFNRPPYLQGRIMYHIAPSSQEAMAWHRAVHADAYKKPKKCYRLEQHYFYPKPWEVLRVGPRKLTDESEAPYASQMQAPGDLPELLPPETGDAPNSEAITPGSQEVAPPLEAVQPEPAPAPQLDLPQLELEDLRGEIHSPSDLSVEAALEPVGFTDIESVSSTPRVETPSKRRPWSDIGTKLRRTLLNNPMVSTRRSDDASRVSRVSVSPDSPFLKQSGAERLEGSGNQ